MTGDHMGGDHQTDKAILEKVTFPLVPRDGLEDSLSRLAAAPAS